MTPVTHSPEFGALATALVAVQSACEPVVKDQLAEVGKYDYTFANLASVWKSCRDALKDAGIAVMQPVSAEGARVVVTTILCHGASGQWLRSEMEIIAQGGNAQAIGSACSYARRYALLGSLGLVTVEEDDDGAKAQEKPVQQTRAPVAPTTVLTHEAIEIKLEECESTKAVMAVVKRWIDPESGTNQDHPLKVLARARFKVLKEQESRT